MVFFNPWLLTGWMVHVVNFTTMNSAHTLPKGRPTWILLNWLAQLKIQTQAL